jgi:hypothetical protein
MNQKLTHKFVVNGKEYVLKAGEILVYQEHTTFNKGNLIGGRVYHLKSVDKNTINKVQVTDYKMDCYEILPDYSLNKKVSNRYYNRFDVIGIMMSKGRKPFVKDTDLSKWDEKVVWKGSRISIDELLKEVKKLL